MTWHRSPVFWFGLPGLIFLIVAWFDSMLHVSSLDVALRSPPLDISNFNSSINAGWHNAGSTAWKLQLDPRLARPGTKWFPLPAYYVSDTIGMSPRHRLQLPHWFLIMNYVALWQLPWLFRYHRRKRIERSLTAPA